jgi:hypothetical protein
MQVKIGQRVVEISDTSVPDISTVLEAVRLHLIDEYKKVEGSNSPIETGTLNGLETAIKFVDRTDFLIIRP